MSEFSNKKGVVLDHNFPVMPIILMAFALILNFIPLAVYRGYQGFTSYLYFASMILIFTGIVLHRVKMQILTGIGTLLFALLEIIGFISNAYIYIGHSIYTFKTVFTMLLSLVAIAAFTVSGLHYVLRRPRPGKAPKLLLMIPLCCLWIIYMIMILVIYIGVTNPVYLLLLNLSYILTAFALMIYTPFREA